MNGRGDILKHFNLIKCLTIITAGLLVLSSAQAQKLLIPVPLAPPPAAGSISHSPVAPPPEPERWTKEDLTLDEQYSTAKKESQAAFHLAKTECQLLSAYEQSACLNQAKTEMDKEMAAINKRFGIPE